jgi:hypothetical protein
MMPVTRILGSLLVALALPVAVTAADGPTRHSGTVIAIDPQRGELILEELGPGRGEQPAMRRRSISFTAATAFNSFIRVNVRDEFAGQFIEVTLDAEDIAPGEFVTVECILERGRLVARRVTLAERALPPSTPGVLQP